MKKYLIALSLFFIPVIAFATSTQLWKSSFTTTADTTKNLCTNKKGIIHSVCVDSGTAAASTFSIFASSATSANPIAVIDATTRGCLVYDVIASTPTGLTYSNSSTANVTILYDCY
jgi:hypothetical protein